MGGRRYIYSGGARRGRGGRDGGRGGGRGRGRRGGRRGSSNANRYHETVRQGQDVAGGGNACERQDDGRDWRRGGRGYDGRNAPAHNGGLNRRGGHRGILGGGRRGAGDRSGGYGGRWEYRERRPFREPQGQVHETDRVTGDTVLILDSQGNVVKWGSLNIDGGGGDQGNIQRAHPGMSATHSSHIVGPPGQILHNTGHERFLVIRVPDRRKWIGDDKKRVAVDDLEPPRQRKYIRTVNERLPTIEAGDASGSAEKGTGSAAQGGAMDVDIVDALSGSPKEVIGSEVDNVVTSIEGENTRERCGSCGQLTHKLDSCVRPGRDGTLHGCPMCNSSAHNVEQCVKWPRMTIGQKYRVLVHNRGRMVPLYTEQEELWYHIFIQRSESMGAEMGTPRYFPYTREFGKGYFGDEEELSSWEEFYDCFDHAILPVDNKTRDERMVRRLFAGAVYQSARDVRPRPRVQTVEDTSELLCDTEDEEERSLG